MHMFLRFLTLTTLALTACTDAGAPFDGDADAGLSAPWLPIADLRADLDRDGTAELDDVADDEGEDVWASDHGAVFLANLDDDGRRCALATFPSNITDWQLAECHDAADEVVNGDDDLQDLAPLRTAPLPDAPDDAFATVSIEGAGSAHSRLFLNGEGGWRELGSGQHIGAASLRRGLRLALEGTDVVRDLSAWNGEVDVSFVLLRESSPRAELSRDTVRLRVAPVLTLSHLHPIQALHVSESGLAANSADEAAFLERIDSVREAAGLSAPLVRFSHRDRWVQDFFEDAYMSMPGPSGRQHVMRVNLRAAEVYAPQNPIAPLREASRLVFERRGPGVAALQQFQLEGGTQSRTYNAMGNTETVPPYGSYPLGRLLRGSSTTGAPDPSFTRMLEAQRAQSPVYVDTSWLQVGHVDETLAFLPSSIAPRGWVLLAADPARARAMFEALLAGGQGAAPVFAGKTWRSGRQDVPADSTVAAVIARPEVLDATARAAIAVEAQLAVLRTELELTDAEIVRAPFLFQPLQGKVTALQPSSANLLALSRTDVAVADPHGPVVDGVDVFKAHLASQLAPHGLRIHWVDDWNLFHKFNGNVHCGTNATREVPEAPWWR